MAQQESTDRLSVGLLVTHTYKTYMYTYIIYILSLNP